jgi:cytochrome c5
LSWKCIAAFCVCAALAPAASLPEDPARKTVEAACASCHSLDLITAKRWDRDQWRRSVTTMMSLGAKLTGEQASDVIGYLAKNFGKKDRGRELVEDVCTYCHGLQKLQGQELSREDWRGLIKGMIFEGAPVTDEELSLILDYLAANFGKKDR